MSSENIKEIVKEKYGDAAKPGSSGKSLASPIEPAGKASTKNGNALAV